MNSRRTLRVAEAIRETVSTLILFELRDPRVKNVTVLGAEVSGDLKHAKVYVSVMADEKHQQLAMHGLNSARGFLQSKIADRLQLRYTPILKFVLDQGVKKSAEASQILRDVLPEPDSSDAEDEPADSATGDETISGLDIESS
jgi:ribosome-binding factor A